MALPDASQSDVPMLIHPEKIRKIWHEDKWFYSVVDIIADLLDKDIRYGSTYWRKLKSRLVGEGNETVTECQRLKLLAPDGKQRFTDMANAQLSNTIIKIVQRTSFHKSKRIARRIDELSIIHPHVVKYFESSGWATNYPITLSSGKIIDIIAQRNEEILIIECKRGLYGSELFKAIGQVLCYTVEYGQSAKPVIACLQGNAGEYAYTCCDALGISIIEVDNLGSDLSSKQAKATSALLGMDLVTEKPLLNEAN